MVDVAPLTQVAVIGSDTAVACPLLSVQTSVAGVRPTLPFSVEIVAPGGLE